MSCSKAIRIKNLTFTIVTTERPIIFIKILKMIKTTTQKSVASAQEHAIIESIEYKKLKDIGYLLVYLLRQYSGQALIENYSY